MTLFRLTIDSASKVSRRPDFLEVHESIRQ